MASVSRRKFWPYDEVSLSRDACDFNRFHVSSPWIKFGFKVDPAHSERTTQLASKFTSNELSGDDLEEIDWFFSSLSNFPLSYVLPRHEMISGDRHEVKKPDLDQSSPQKLILSLCREPNEAIRRFSERLGSWTWDVDAAQSFSRTHDGYDPESLFSVGRRFHLLNDLEQNQTGEMLKYVKGIKEQELFSKASALIVRQNHYITAQCDSVLRAALPIAQSADVEVMEFIQAEAGHDAILATALNSMGESVESVPAIDTVIALMEVFREIAKRNLLAFAMTVDIFERSSYQKEDPLAGLLRYGGHETAARQADIHRDINDSGGHENAALNFLANMAVVDAEYAQEALRLAELATLTIHQLSRETLEKIKEFTESPRV